MIEANIFNFYTIVMALFHLGMSASRILFFAQIDLMTVSVNVKG